MGLASLILFALAAERITDALDQGKVNEYMYSMLIYNIAVVLLFLSLAVFLFAQEKEKQAYIEEICKED